MGLLDTLSHLIAGHSTNAAAQLRAALEGCYVDCFHRAVQLKRHAELAPQRYSMEALKELANAEERQCDRLRQAIEAAGAPVAAAMPEVLARSGSNHWARVVRDLEAHRASVQQFREAAVRFAEPFPQTAALFQELCVEETSHCRNLRALIARTDPQALD
jgi:hypothetical protein